MNAGFSPNEKRIRLLAIVLLPLELGLLRQVSPEAAPSWFPASCGAVTGLPCIFCGMTRATHYLLNGNFPRALYFNWLAFPFLAAAVMVYFALAGELLLERRLLFKPRWLRFTRGSFAALVAGLLLLWVLQVYLAVSQHKTELLNPRGPLYSLVVR